MNCMYFDLQNCLHHHQIKEQDYCRMKLILSYFGEKNVDNCNNCDVCKSTSVSVRSIENELEFLLSLEALDLQQISVRLPQYNSEDILIVLKFMLDIGKIKMKDFKTYQIVK